MYVPLPIIFNEVTVVNRRKLCQQKLALYFLTSTTNNTNMVAVRTKAEATLGPFNVKGKGEVVPVLFI
jgi:hypothetical protein